MNHDFDNPSKIKHRGAKVLFSHPLLEKISRTHISVPVAIFLIYGGILLFWNVSNTTLSGQLTASLFVAGLFAFTWVEYNIHRYLFHMSTVTRLREKFQYVIHGVHHEFPKDKGRLAMPPLLSITIATLLLFFFRIIMGDLVFAFMPGFFTGYAAYLTVHYLVHAYQPPRNFLRSLWVNHAIHHYKDGEVVFGVSSPLWDYIYGTMPKNSLK